MHTKSIGGRCIPIYIIFTLLIVTVFGILTTPVMGALGIYSENFETGTLNNDFTGDYFYTYEHYDPVNCEFEIDTHGGFPATGYEGVRLFLIDDNNFASAGGFWNYTIVGVNEFLVEWDVSYYIDIENLNGNEGFAFYFGDRITISNYTTDCVLFFRFEIGLEIYYTDHNHVEQDSGLRFAENEWRQFGWRFNNSNEVMMWNTTHSTDGTPFDATGNQRITNVLIKTFDAVAGKTNKIAFDSHSFEVNDEIAPYESQGGSGGGTDYSNNLMECNLEGMIDLSVSPYVGSPNFFGNVIESRHDVKYLKTVKAIDFYFSDEQYFQVPELYKYDLHLPGGFTSKPTEWIFIDSQTYVLRWDNMDYSMKTIPYFTFFISELIIKDTETPTYLKASPEDISWKSTKTHGDLFYYGNEKYDGDWLAGGVALSHSICIIFDEVQVVYDCEYPDDKLFVNPLITKTGQTVAVNYQLTTKFTDTYLNITFGGESITKQPFTVPALLDECSSNEFSFIPWSTGIYNVSLWRTGTGMLYTVLVTVNENPDKDAYVTSYPNPSKVYNDYTVLVNYTHPNTYDGALFISDTPDIDGLTPFTTFPSGTLNATYKRNNIYPSIIYYILAFKNPSGGYGIMPTLDPESSIHPHIVEGLGSSDDWIIVKGNVVFDKGKIGTQYFTCNHGFIGQEVVVRDNGYKVADVPNGFYNEIPYDVIVVGNHFVELVLIDCCGGTDTVLATANYTAANMGGVPPTGELFPDLRGSIVGYTLGMIVFVVSLFSPILIVYYLKAKTDLSMPKIPVMVYGFAGAFGIVFPVFLNCWDWDVPFVVIVIGLIIVVISWIRSKKEE